MRALAMSDVTRILSQIESGDPSAAEQLLPLIYEELRKLAAAKLAHEKPGQTLQATDLVHDAYIRLVDVEKARHWNSRGHFFAAAAEAMRRILVDRARQRLQPKHGGHLVRHDVESADIADLATPEETIAVHDALDGLAGEDPLAADLVKLRYFAGCSIEEAADVLGLSRATAYRTWTYARAWLRASLHNGGDSG
jgi:RNA polymerase sigma factor (TIGR02999 family)